MAHFPGTLRPIRLEGDILDLEADGEIPEQLNGTFHRVHRTPSSRRAMRTTSSSTATA